jgi:hypothetical protein
VKTKLEQFIRERKYLSNVTPATVEWYTQSLQWLDTESPTDFDLKNFVIRMRERGLKTTGCLLFALFVLANANGAGGFAAVIGIVAALFLFAGIGAKKAPDQLATAQSSWDSRWLCARCGNQWQP